MMRSGDLKNVQRVLLVTPDGVHFPAAAVALRETGFNGALRVLSAAEWRPVIEGKCAQFLALPASEASSLTKARGLALSVLAQLGWAQAVIWVMPSPLGRRVLIRLARSRCPVFSFHDGNLEPYTAGKRLTGPGLQHVGGAERELAMQYLAPVLKRRRQEAAPMRIGLDGDAMQERWATGVQWYRRHLFAALSADEVPVDLAVTSSSQEIRCAWELPWSRNLCPVPGTMRSYSSTSSPCPVEAITGPIDLFHMTLFEPARFSYSNVTATVYDVMPLAKPSAFPPRFLERCKAISSFYKDKCDHLICISEYTRRDLEQIVGIAPDRLSVIYPGKHPHFHRRDAAEVARVQGRYGIRGPYFLAVGSVVPHKNFQGLCNAFLQAKAETGIPHQLVIVGRPNWRNSEVFSAIQQSGHARDIVFTGYAAFEDLPALYSGAEAYCHSSIYEGYGLPVQEAICCGCPVLISNTTSLPEVGGDAAIYWDPTSVEQMAALLVQFVRDDTLRAGLPEKLAAQAARYPTWDAVARQHVAVYDRVLGRV
jgi:glycosyltransferase involved in cell wall biosynthesis